MSTIKKFFVFSLAGAAFLGSTARAQNGTESEQFWPQWRGPNLNGVSPAENLPAEWSETKNIVWKAELPWWSGSTPIIWGDRIFVTSPGKPEAREEEASDSEEENDGRRGRRFGRGSQMNPGGQELLLICLNRKDGGALWTREIDEGNRIYRKQNNASPSPVTDGEHVWVMTGNGALSCFDFEGNKKWARNIQEDYGRFGLNWGYASSPLLYRDRLIIPVLHGMRTDDPSYVLAVDKMTGETLWRTERPTDAPRESPDSYVTPQLLEVEDRVEVILNGGDLVTGHDIQTGEEIWRANVLNPRKNGNYRIIPSSLIVGDIIIAPTRINPMTALKAGGEGDVSDSHVLWQNENGPDVPTPISDGKYLWTITGDRSLISCLDVKTGEVLYDQERLPSGTYSSSLVLADEKIYATNESGTTVVLPATPEFEILATNEIEGGHTLSSLAIAGNQIFLRSSNKLYCIAKLE